MSEKRINPETIGDVARLAIYSYLHAFGSAGEDFCFARRA
jgi:hypothetical protein